MSLALLLVYTGVVVCAQPRSSHPVILPVLDGHNIHFNHVFAHSRVHSITQDDQGFLWFATSDKLQRYDGYDVREHPYDSRLNDSNVVVRALTKDRSGKLWVARDRGAGIGNVPAPHGVLDLYDPATEFFTRYPPHDQPFDRPSGITQDRDGELWVATNEGLFRMDPISGRTIRYQHREDDPASLSANSVRSTLEVKDGTFWVATTKGLDLFDRRTGKVVQRIRLPEDLAAGNRGDALMVSLCEDHSGVLWAIFSSGYGLAQVDRRAGRLIFYSLDGTGTDNNAQSGAKSIVEDQDGVLWIGTSFSGILKFDRDRSRFVRYRNSPNAPDTLGGDQVLALFEDREGNIWVATNDAGVDRFPARPNPFKHYRHEPGDPNTLDTNYTSSVYEDSHHILWVGSNRALYQIDRKGSSARASLMSVATGRITTIKHAGSRGELSGTWILSIAEDRAGYLWFGTVDAGLNRLDRRTGKFKVYRHDPADPRSLSDNRVQKLFVDHKGVLWAGTDKGVDTFDPLTEKFRRYQVDRVNELRVRDIAEDSQGALWIATGARGLLRLDPVSRQFTVYQHTTQPGSLSSDKAWAVCVGRDGIVWIGTESGLNRFDPATQTFVTYYESDGLADNRVSHILEDDRGRLWVSTHYGLSRFSPREKTFRNYYSSDGLEDNEFYDNSSSWKSPSGEMFFSNNGGLAAFFPREMDDDPSVPPVAITDFKISGKSMTVGKDSPLKRGISFTESVTLSNTQNVLSLEFATLSYTSPERNRYRYRLEPREAQWNESEGGRRSISYALSPGEYVFRVQGTNLRAAWNEKGANVRIVILPPWWNTWQFRSAAVALILVLLACAYYLHLQNIKRQFALRLEERVDERTRLARDLHDTLLQTFHGLMLRLQVVDELLPPGKAKDELEETLESGDQAIVEARNAVHDLRSSTTTTSDLAQAVGALGDELAAGNTATFRLVVEGPMRDLHPIVRDEIYRVAREAVRNAFAHASAKHIEAEITYNERQLRLRIRDDGEGISPEILGDGRAGHYGLPGMRERASQLGAKLTIWSNRGAGTEIDLSISGSIAYGKPSGRSRLSLFRRSAG